MRTNALSYPPFHSDREGEHLTTNHENKYIIMDCDIIFLKKLVAKLAKNELKKQNITLTVQHELSDSINQKY